MCCQIILISQQTIHKYSQKSWTKQLKDTTTRRNNNLHNIGLKFRSVKPSVFYPYFSCVRARDLKFYDFLKYIKINFVNYSFFKKFSLAATGLWYKIVKNGLIAF